MLPFVLDLPDRARPSASTTAVLEVHSPAPTRVRGGSCSPPPTASVPLERSPSRRAAVAETSPEIGQTHGSAEAGSKNAADARSVHTSDSAASPAPTERCSPVRFHG